MQLTDTHSHLYAEEFDADRAEALQRARDAGVGTLLLPAIDSLTHERLFTMAAAEPAMCRPMMGLHPTSVNDNPRWREELQMVERYLAEPPNGLKFCAVGEIGLDYYWSRDFVAEQREAFIEQCRLAASLDLPVAIHTRAAWDDMYDILREECDRARQRGERLRGVLHAFSEDADTFRRLRECGDWLFGIGGVVTFRKSVISTSVAEIPLEQIVLETDCPYLTPVPHRGERNESAYVRYVCEAVARIKGLDPEHVAAVMNEPSVMQKKVRAVSARAIKAVPEKGMSGAGGMYADLMACAPVQEAARKCQLLILPCFRTGACVPEDLCGPAAKQGDKGCPAGRIAVFLCQGAHMCASFGHQTVADSDGVLK